jgi:hypothetical protein
MSAGSAGETGHLFQTENHVGFVMVIHPNVRTVAGWLALCA